MKVYFVRHGEGEHNVRKLFSAPEFSLTEKGRKQAEVAAERIRSLPIEIIISSPYVRTKQTADIINRYLKKEIIFSDLVGEIIRPTEIAGKVQHDPEIAKIKQLMDENFSNLNWHYSDEENFYDLKNRAKKFIKYLEGFKQNHILVVSHIHFIRMAVLVMLFGMDITAEIFLKAMKVMRMETSGLTICEKDEKDWKLITWNDHAHLAESS